MAGPLPPLPPPWVARPLPCLLCPRCQKSRWAGSTLSIWQAAPGIPPSEPGALQLVLPLEQGGELARFSLLAAPRFPCFWAVGSGRWVAGAKSERHPATGVYPRQRPGGGGSFRFCWLGAGEGLLEPPTPTPLPLPTLLGIELKGAGPLCPPTGDRRQVRPVCPERVLALTDLDPQSHLELCRPERPAVCVCHFPMQRVSVGFIMTVSRLEKALPSKPAFTLWVLGCR